MHWLRFTTNVRSILMWSHYAGQHQGFCVEYPLTKIDPKLPQRRLLFPVIYSETRLDLTKIFRATAEGGTSGWAIMAALHKASDWSYEKEWRLIDLGALKDPYEALMPRPSAIYLGTRIKDSDKATIVKVAAGMGVPVHQMHLSPKAYEIVPSPDPL